MRKPLIIAANFTNSIYALQRQVRNEQYLSAKQQVAYQKIAKYLQQHPSISNKQAQQLLAKSPATIKRYLQSMVANGLLQATGNNKARVYQLASDAIVK